ncbi:plasma membrane ascorbate-dependent reductase CYBRD1-like [Labrus bergylta]|uniref:plasma membrane ascorbate-dependent reductase CYBRD1-like n=1 Tax=Labrus bergylta TaxID=56723 RepID=UPI0033137A9F
MENHNHFMVALSAALAFGSLTIIFVLRWVSNYRDGLAWDGGPANFNWHPVLQLSGFVFLNGLGIIAFRLPWTHQLSKESVKLIHAALNTLAFFCAIMALKAVFGSQSGSNFPDLFSLHSWLGITVVSLFGIEIALAASIYLFPITPESWKAAFHPLHVFLGRFLFGSTICVSLIGLTERLIFSLNDPKYSDSPPEAFFANVMGLLLVAYGVAIFWISTNKSWKHPGPPIWHTSGLLEDKIK